MSLHFFNNRRGLSIQGTLVGFLVVFALAVILFLIIKNFPSMAQGAAKVATCGGASFGGKTGVCVPESQSCNERVRSGCDDYPGRPVCCFDSAVVSEATATRNCVCYETSEQKAVTNYHGYGNPEECQSSCANFCRSSPYFPNSVAVCVGSLTISGRARCSVDNVCEDLKTCLDRCYFATNPGVCSFDTSC